LKKLNIDSEKRKQKTASMLKCGGISDILYTVGNTGEIQLSKQFKRMKDEKSIDVIERIDKERKNYWERFKYVLEKFMERQMQRTVSISTTLKGEYVRKYLPILERIITTQTDYINEFGRMYDDKEDAEHVSHSGTGKERKPEYMFRKAGEGFEIKFKGKPSILLKETVGLKYIQFLLSNPNTTIPVQELASIRQNVSSTKSRRFDYDTLQKDEPGSHKEYSDEELRPIAHRLEQKLREKEEANNAHDYEKAEKLQAEIEEMAAYLREAKNRKHNPQTEKLRIGVKNAISDAVKRIEAYDSELAQHLNERVSTGYTCMYSNPPFDKITWYFE
jgi:hypothetical protein